MLPSLTAVARRRRLSVRGLAALAGGALLAGSVLLAMQGGSPAPTPVATPTADALAPGTWAIAVPTSWFVAPIAGLRAGDRLDVLAIRPGERATATAVAFDLLVVSADEHAVVVGSGADDATALGVARASGLLLIPLLRSTR